jgi:hypothetical protein
MDKPLFQEINVWREVNENTFYRYRCLKNLETGKYCLFGREHIHRHNYDNVSVQRHHEFAFRQSLFAGGLNNLDESEMFESIEEAIADFDN